MASTKTGAYTLSVTDSALHITQSGMFFKSLLDLLVILLNYYISLLKLFKLKLIEVDILEIVEININQPHIMQFIKTLISFIIFSPQPL